MNYRHLVPAWVFIGFLVAGLAGEASASPRLQAYPVKLLGYEGDNLRISFELPCGSSYYGLIATSDEKGKLSLAAASLQPEILCTGMPQEQQMLIKYLATSTFKAIASIDTDSLLNRLSLLPINEVLSVKAKNGSPSLRAVYETRCGEVVGTLIHQASSKDLQVAMVELRERPQGMASTGATECTYDQKLKPITAIALDEGYNVQPLLAKPGDMSRVSYLRLAKVDAAKLAMLKSSPANDVKVSYFRHCNEAPVGIVVGKSETKLDSKTGQRSRDVPVGILVAHYINKHCGPGETGEWTEFQASDLALHVLAVGVSTRLLPLGETAGVDTLRLKSPFELNRGSIRGQSAQLMIDFFKTCEQSIGVVYARDINGRLAVGVLTKGATASSGVIASQCIKSASGATLGMSVKSSMVQPFLSRNVRAVDLYPMKIKGIM